jgi:2-polyprenyl-6-methoxyphenol hydroxylase-like FAD-dependent oxidoreductase
MDHEIYDVAVVGYGPVGQLLAILLGQKGYRVAVFERWHDVYPLPRALHYDHEIARVLQAAGVADQVAPLIDSGGFYEWRNADREILLRFDWNGMGSSGWPVSNVFSQPELENILDAKARSFPTVQVNRGWETIDASQSDNGVALTVRKGESPRPGEWTPTGETRTIRARYLIGADGANSIVRQWMSVTMTDLGFKYDWFVVDIKPHEEREWVPYAWQWCNPARPTTIVPSGPGRRRWEFMRLLEEPKEDFNGAETAWRLLEPWDMTPQNATLERSAMYTFQARWANEWRVGRMLLAGDAAHLMPPFGAQGMCSGLRDAANVAWHLDLVLSNRAPDRILDSYTSERIGNVQMYIGFSVELGKMICITDPQVAAIRDAQLFAAQKDPSLAPPPPPPMRLGPGMLHEGDPLAGLLFVQGHVAQNGSSGLFDDVVGRGFVLLSNAGDPANALSAESRAFFECIGGTTAHVSADGPVVDLDGTYAQWFAQNQAAVVLARPDFYIFGAAPTLDGAEQLVADLRRQMA